MKCGCGGSRSTQSDELPALLAITGLEVHTQPWIEAKCKTCLGRDFGTRVGKEPKERVVGSPECRDLRNREPRDEEMAIFWAVPLCPPPSSAPTLVVYSAISPHSLPLSSRQPFCFWPCQWALERRYWKEGWGLNWDSVTIHHNKIWTIGHQRNWRREVPSSWETLASVYDGSSTHKQKFLRS